MQPELVAEFLVVVAMIVLVVVEDPVPEEPDKNTDKTFLKLAALSLKPSTGPVPHGCDENDPSRKTE
jgi:hypothetical protein